MAKVLVNKTNNNNCWVRRVRLAKLCNSLPWRQQMGSIRRSNLLWRTYSRPWRPSNSRSSSSSSSFLSSKTNKIQRIKRDRARRRSSHPAWRGREWKGRLLSKNRANYSLANSKSITAFLTSFLRNSFQRRSTSTCKLRWTSCGRASLKWRRKSMQSFVSLSSPLIRLCNRRGARIWFRRIIMVKILTNWKECCPSKLPTRKAPFPTKKAVNW